MAQDFGSRRHSMGGADFLSRRSLGVSGGANISTSHPTSSGKGGAATAFAAIYTFSFPSANELRMSLSADASSVEEMREVVAELNRQVDLLREETGVLTKFSESIRRFRANGSQANGSGGNGEEDGGLAVSGEPHRSGPLLSEMGLKANTEGGIEEEDMNEMDVFAGSHGIEEKGSSRKEGQRWGSRGGGGTGRSQRNRSTTSSSSVHTRQGRGSTPGGKSATWGQSLTSDAEGVEAMLTEDKLMLINKEIERLHQQEEKGTKESEEIKDLLVATVAEASRRMKELRLEVIRFNREVMDEEKGIASGNLLILYMERRALAQKGYLDKLLGQCQAVEEDIARAQQQVRARRAAGEAFHAIDFEQLRIENQQFNERIDKKNQELVELKGTSTRTVQTLNSLMDALNDMTNEQAQLKKEYKSRCDYLARCTKEVGVVVKEAEKAEGKHHALKSQHEAVKVPKIEEYIAQKAELFELEKACKNWQRKVEIAEGQRQVLRQQLERLRLQRNAAIEYSKNKKKRLLENLGKCPTKLPVIGTASKPPPGVALLPGFAPVEAMEPLPPVGDAARESNRDLQHEFTATSAVASPSNQPPKFEKPKLPVASSEERAAISEASPIPIYDFPSTEES